MGGHQWCSSATGQGFRGVHRGERMTVGHIGLRGLHAVLSEHSRSAPPGISNGEDGLPRWIPSTWRSLEDEQRKWVSL